MKSKTYHKGMLFITTLLSRSLLIIISKKSSYDELALAGYGNKYKARKAVRQND